MAHLALARVDLEELATEQAQEEFYDSEFQGGGSFGLRVSKKGRKAFFLIYAIHGKRKRMTLGHYPLLDLEKARERAFEALAEVERGGDPAASRKRYRTAESFETFAERFLQEHVAGRCAESTQREYRRIIQRELIPVWGDRKVADISEQDVHRLLADIALERDSPVMANRVRALAGTIFSYACSLHICSENPVLASERLIEDGPRTFALSIKEAQELWLKLDLLPTRPQAAFKLLLLSGQRVKDVLQMRWQDVQLDSWAVAGDKEHRLFLSPPAQQVLRSLMSVTGHQEFVFSSERGAPLRDIRKLCSRLTIEGIESWSPADLRRTVEVRLRELGIRPDVIAYVLNQRTALRKLTTQAESYDYFPESQRALIRWARTIVPVPEKPPKKGGGKVIPLFREL